MPPQQRQMSVRRGNGRPLPRRLVVNEEKEGGARCRAMRDGGSSRGYAIRRSNQWRRDLPLEGWSEAAVSERNASGESRAIRAVRHCPLPGLRRVVLRVDVAGIIGGTVLDDLAMSANMDMRVRQNRRRYTERQRKPGEIEFPAYNHEASGSSAPSRRKIMILSVVHPAKTNTVRGYIIPQGHLFQFRGTPTTRPPNQRRPQGWWRRRGSNPRPSHCERDALPAELRPRRAEIIARWVSGVNSHLPRLRRMRSRSALSS